MMAGRYAPDGGRRARELARRTVKAGARPAALVLHAYTNEHAIYGTVLVSALIAIGWNDDTDLQVFLFTVGTVAVFWLAHVYARSVGHLTEARPGFPAIAVAVASAARESAPMVVSMLIPSVFLLLATMDVLDQYVAYYIALWSGVAVLAVLGYLNSRRRGSPMHLRLIGAGLTSVLGLGIIWLSSLVH